jgi:hypothetical protein
METKYWKKSSYSEGVSNCVELALTHDGRAAVRDSKNPGVAMDIKGLPELLRQIHQG